ncbi:MAG: hypothetical protein JXA53_10800 [Bacteroidales bacterium]|nr:hypothetical protein [Bacteroidales bacterium]
MNITTVQLQAFRGILSKEDKANIALHTEKSVRTVEAVLQGDRQNDDIEQLVLIAVKQNIARYYNIVADVEAKNTLKVTTLEYTKYRESAAWTNDMYYNRYIDIYLQLAHYNCKDEDELWSTIWNNYKDIIQKAYYCVDLFCRLLGFESATATRFYNKKIVELQ